MTNRSDRGLAKSRWPTASPHTKFLTVPFLPIHIYDTATGRPVAANSRRWWCNSGKLLNRVLNLAWFDRLGLARLS